LVGLRDSSKCIHSYIDEMTEDSNIKSCSINSGMKISYIEWKLLEKQHLIIGTPDWVNIYVEKKLINLSSLKYLIIDEADEFLLWFEEKLKDLIFK